MIGTLLSRRSSWPFVVMIGGMLCSPAQAADSSAPADPDMPERVRAPESYEDAPRLAAATQPGAEHPLAPAIRHAQDALMRLQNVQDYEATLIARERIDRRLVEHTMHLKVREKPLSIYLKYGEPAAGREVLFVQGKNNDKLWRHEGGGLPSLVGTVSLDPHDQQAQGEHRHPVTMLGMRQRLEAVIAQWKYESAYGECDVRYFPNAKLRGRPCEVIESSHPRPRRQFPFQRTLLYLDAHSRLPVRIDQYAFPTADREEPPLAESYEYANLKVNPGLTDADFDRQNPHYSF